MLDQNHGSPRRSPRRSPQPPPAASASASTRSPRRSPRLANNDDKGKKRCNNDETMQTPTAKKRLKYLQQLQQRKKRTPTPVGKRLVRQTLGQVMKRNMDARILNGEFLGHNRTFLLDTFEDAVRPIIDAIFHGDNVDTSQVTKPEMFALAVDIAKKREQYGKKRKPTKKVII